MEKREMDQKIKFKDLIINNIKIYLTVNKSFKKN